MVLKFSSLLKPAFKNLELDNNGTYFEDLIYGSIRVDIIDMISVKAQLSKAFSIQPSEIDKMPFWEFELFVKELEKLVKEENKQNEDKMNSAGVKDAMKMAKPGAMQKMMSSAMPKMSNMSMPKSISMPSYNLR